MELVSSLAGPNTQLVPGHGVITKSDIPRHRDMIMAIQAKVKQLVDQGRTLAKVLEANPTAPYDASVPGGTTPLPGVGNRAERFVRTM